MKKLIAMLNTFVLLSSTVTSVVSYSEGNKNEASNENKNEKKEEDKLEQTLVSIIEQIKKKNLQSLI